MEMRKLQTTLSLAAVVIAAIALVPSFGQWLFPRSPGQPAPPPVAQLVPTSHAVSPAESSVVGEDSLLRQQQPDTAFPAEARPPSRSLLSSERPSTPTAESAVPPEPLPEPVQPFSTPAPKYKSKPDISLAGSFVELYYVGDQSDDAIEIMARLSRFGATVELRETYPEEFGATQALRESPCWDAIGKELELAAGVNEMRTAASKTSCYLQPLSLYLVPDQSEGK